MFLREAALELGKTPPHLTEEVLMVLRQHPWPGNVRELKSAMKRAALFAGETLTYECLSRVLSVADRPSEVCRRPMTLDQMEQQAVRQALEATGGKKMEAARLLDVEYRRFKRMLEKYGL